MATYQVNYGYAVNKKLRSGSLILNAKDPQQVKKDAATELAKEHDWFRINSVKQLDATTTIV